MEEKKNKQGNIKFNEDAWNKVFDFLLTGDYREAEKITPEYSNIALSANFEPLFNNYIVNTVLSGVISRGLITNEDWSIFLIEGICDPRLFIIVSHFAYKQIH